MQLPKGPINKRATFWFHDQNRSKLGKSKGYKWLKMAKEIDLLWATELKLTNLNLHPQPSHGDVARLHQGRITAGPLLRLLR